MSTYLWTLGIGIIVGRVLSGSRSLSNHQGEDIIVVIIIIVCVVHILGTEDLPIDRTE